MVYPAAFSCVFLLTKRCGSQLGKTFARESNIVFFYQCLFKQYANHSSCVTRSQVADIDETGAVARKTTRQLTPIRPCCSVAAYFVLHPKNSTRTASLTRVYSLTSLVIGSDPISQQTFRSHTDSLIKHTSPSEPTQTHAHRCFPQPDPLGQRLAEIFLNPIHLYADSPKYYSNGAPPWCSGG